VALVACYAIAWLIIVYPERFKARLGNYYGGHYLNYTTSTGENGKVLILGYDECTKTITVKEEIDCGYDAVFNIMR
jgi:hypothetical protein